jgi:hypothetical protein
MCKNLWTPDTYRSAHVIPLCLKGDQNEYNYRGISVLSSACKIHVKIVKERLIIITDAVLLEEQEGFRTVSSTRDTEERRIEFRHPLGFHRLRKRIW